MNVGFYKAIPLIVLTGWISAPFTPGLAQQLPANQGNLPQTHVVTLPPASVKILVAVPKFRHSPTNYALNRDDQVKATASPADAPDYTNVLLASLKESGWFLPVEHESIASLLNERPKKETASLQSAAIPSPSPELFIEGGVLSHSTEVIADGQASRYFGNGGAGQYQQDRVTVYLRAVSTRSGRILTTIYSPATLLSQEMGGGSFRFVSLKEPYRGEAGQTTTEPAQLAVIGAIRQAVRGLIIEGVRDGLWRPESSTAMNSLINVYEREKTIVNETDVSDVAPEKGPLGLRPRIKAPFISIHPYAGSIRYKGDYTNEETRTTYGIAVDMYITPVIGIQVNAATGTLASQDAFSVNLTSLEANVVLRLLPNQRFTPLVYAGVGSVSRSSSMPFPLYGAKYGQVQAGLGLQYSFSRIVGLRTSISYSQPFTDGLDGQVLGNYRDYYTRATIGLVFHLGRFKPATKPMTISKAP